MSIAGSLRINARNRYAASVRSISSGGHANDQDVVSRPGQVGHSACGNGRKKIPFPILIGFVTAMPLSYVVARKIGASPTR
jgi:hypothetical protein